MIREIRVLDSNQIETVHSTSLRILRKVGMRLRSDRHLTHLQKQGFDVDKVHFTVKMPENQVIEALERTPKKFRLCSRDRKRDLQMGEGNCYYASAGCASDVVDFESGMRRPATLQDVASCAKVIDAVENLDMIFSPISAHDVPRGTGVIDEYKATVENSTKHVHLVDLNSVYEAEYIIKIAGEIMGGVDNLIKEPIISDMLCTVSPLTMDTTALDTVLTFARKGLPVSSTSMPLAGGTGPITPAGTLALSNAEVIGALVIIEAFCPNTPVIYTAFPAVMDPRTGFYRGAAPEEIWMGMAVGQVAGYYKIPYMVGGMNSSSKTPNIQDGYEKAMCAVLSRLAGADILVGPGLLDSASALALDQLIVDGEVCDHLDRALADQPIDEETLGLEVISRVGPESHFISDRHTLRHVGDIWIPRLPGTDRVSRADPESMVKKAKKRVRDILKSHQPQPLDPSTKKRIEMIVSEARKNYQHSKN